MEHQDNNNAGNDKDDYDEVVDLDEVNDVAGDGGDDWDAMSMHLAHWPAPLVSSDHSQAPPSSLAHSCHKNLKEDQNKTHLAGGTDGAVGELPGRASSC